MKRSTYNGTIGLFAGVAVVLIVAALGNAVAGFLTSLSIELDAGRWPAPQAAEQHVSAPALPDVSEQHEGQVAAPIVRTYRRESSHISRDAIRRGDFDLGEVLSARYEFEDLSFHLSEEERGHRRELSRRLQSLADSGEDYRAREDAPEDSRAGLLAEADPTPLYEEGELVGVQLDEIKNGGVFYQFGLRSGDVIVAINDLKLADAETSIGKLSVELIEADSLEVEVERGDGEVDVLAVAVEEFIESIDDLEELLFGEPDPSIELPEGFEIDDGVDMEGLKQRH